MKRENDTSVANNSLLILADNLVRGTEKVLKTAKTEEDLKIGFEKLLEPIKNELGITSIPKYEKSVFRGRSDAVHGQLIFEYEPPKSFSSKNRVQHAYDQLTDYLLGESEHSPLTQLVGVGFDGATVFFVQYQGKKSKSVDKTKFLIQGPYDFNSESARTLLIHLRALVRLPLTAENLVQKFGPESDLAPRVVCAFANALEHWGNQTKIQTYFNEWNRLFGIVYGEQFSGQQKAETEFLLTLYKVSKETSFQELLFSVHTYFAFLMKIIAAELLTLRETTFSSSLAHKLAHASEDELKNYLTDIEDGGVYARRGITNFLEGDFFRWYLNAWNPVVKDAICEIAHNLSEFEPATSTLNPSATRDLLKKLYQYLIPREVRHRLGEYYTPDWLAELLINEVGYDGNNLKRLLDPACGSGTFLVLAIQRAKEYGKKEKWRPLEIGKRIVANIWGFDLNPLAVIAARTNYIFALGDLVNELKHIEIPIYLADSVLTPTRITQDIFGEFLEVTTSIDTFQIPPEWARESFLLGKAAPLIEEMVKNRYTAEEAMERFKKEGLVFPCNERIVKILYSKILALNENDQNGIWSRFLKNAFAPMVAGQFDFVVGNPPWIRWDYLAQDYRDATSHLWKNYGLFSLKGFQARLGGGKKDFSMLFLYASADYYLKNGGKLGFLITQEVLKSKGAGEGFRQFQIGDKQHLKVLKAHDFVAIQPFEGATNKTAAIILTKGKKTEYPIPYFVWTKRKGVGKISTDKLLYEISLLLKKKKYTANPIGSNVGAWQTYPAGTEGLTVIKGINYYKAILGGNPNPYGVFWVEIKQLLTDGNILICNLPERGKLEIQKIERPIEQNLIYPAIRGSDIKRWGYQQTIFFLMVQDPKTRIGYPEDFIKQNYPRTYDYLLRFKDVLLSRSLYKKYHEQGGAPFYSQFNISDETLSQYKVIWKAMTTDIYAVVISQIKTEIGFKTGIPLHTTSFFSTDNEPEAHYLCAIINSNTIRNFIKSFSSAGRGFGTPSVMQYVGIPKFDPESLLHQKLAGISKSCHRLKTEDKESEIEKLESANDELVKQLFRT